MVDFKQGTGGTIGIHQEMSQMGGLQCQNIYQPLQVPDLQIGGKWHDFSFDRAEIEVNKLLLYTTEDIQRCAWKEEEKQQN